MEMETIFVRQKILSESYDHFPVCIMNYNLDKFHLSPFHLDEGDMTRPQRVSLYTERQEK